MPKTNLGKDESTESLTYFIGCVEKHIKVKNLDKKTLAVKLHMSYRTLNDKLQHPTRITLQEAIKICKLLKFEDLEKLKIF